MWHQVAFILAVIFLGVTAASLLPLRINGKDTGEKIELLNIKCDLNEMRNHLEKQGIVSTSVRDCETLYDKAHHPFVRVTVERFVKVYEETGLSGTVITFAVRKVKFLSDLGIQKDDKGNILALKDRKTTFTGIQLWEKLNLKQGDKLYKTNPEVVKSVKELENFEIKFDTESKMILEEQNTLFVLE